MSPIAANFDIIGNESSRKKKEVGIINSMSHTLLKTLKPKRVSVEETGKFWTRHRKCYIWLALYVILCNFINWSQSLNPVSFNEQLMSRSTHQFLNHYILWNKTMKSRTKPTIFSVSQQKLSIHHWDWEHHMKFLCNARKDNHYL